MNAYYLQVLYNKKGLQKPLNANKVISNYLFMTYIVTSKPKRISVAAGVVHIIFPFLNLIHTVCITTYYLKDLPVKYVKP